MYLILFIVAFVLCFVVIPFFACKSALKGDYPNRELVQKAIAEKRKRGG